MKNEMLCFQSWVKENVITVKQIIEDGEWKDVTFINETFRDRQMLASFELSKLKKAFPRFWLDKLRNDIQTPVLLHTKEFDAIELSTGDKISVQKTSAKHYYRLFLHKKKQEPSCLYLWQGYLNLSCDFDWKNVLQYKFHQINDNRIKQFNFNSNY